MNEKVNVEAGEFVKGTTNTKYLVIAVNKGYRLGVRPYIFATQGEGDEVPFIRVGFRGRIEVTDDTENLEPEDMEKLADAFGFEAPTYKGDRHASFLCGIRVADHRARKGEVAEVIEANHLSDRLVDFMLGRLQTAGATVHTSKEALKTYLDMGYEEATEDKIPYSVLTQFDKVEVLPAKGWL